MARSIFSYRLMTLRKMRHMTQQQVADKLGVSRSTYTCYEVGNSMPTAASLCALGDLFEVSLDYLLGRHEDPDLYDLGDPDFARGMMAVGEYYHRMNKEMRRSSEDMLRLFSQGQTQASDNKENDE